MHQKRPAFFERKLGRFLFLTLLLFPCPLLALDSDDFFFKAQTQLQFAVRPISQNWLGFPVLALQDVSAALQATESLYSSVSALGRLPVSSDDIPHIDAFVDLGDAYMKYTNPHFTLTVGQLRLPWQRLTGASLNDRLNPVDYRRGRNFSNDVNARIPQWGFGLRSTIFEWTTEGACFLWHRPDSSSYVAVEQDGVQIGRYQGAIARTRSELGMLLSAPLVKDSLPWFTSPSIGVRTSKFFGSFDLAFSLVWGFDEVPVVIQPNQLTSGRSLSLGAESSITLGVLILKAEVVATPKIGTDMGKVTLLKSTSGMLTSSPLTNITLGVGLDGQYGEALTGSLELIDTLWFGVPANFHIHAIESPDVETSGDRFVQRLALGFWLGGKLWEEAVEWSLRGEAGLNRPDVLSTINLQYNFGQTGFAVGVFGNVFFGVYQSPGWFRSPATEFGVKAVYHL